MIKRDMYIRAYHRIVEVLDLAIAQALKEDRDDDYDKLVNCRYQLDEIHTIIKEVI